MKYAFCRPVFDLEKWSEITQVLSETAREIAAGNCSDEELISFCRQAVRDARPVNGKEDMLFWGYDDPAGMPGEACCEFFFKPGYFMVQCMIAAVLRKPYILRLEGVRDTLEKGLLGCTANSLKGHGYDSEEELLSNLNAFLSAGYAAFAMRYPQICPAFHNMFLEAITHVKHDYEIGIHTYGWNSQLKEKQEEILQAIPEWLFHDYSCQSNEILYVAYGSNMDEQQMADRCPGAELIGIGTIYKYQLDFYLYATVSETNSKKSNVPVAVWRINRRHEQSLDHYEGVKGHYYYKSNAVVKLNNGCTIEGLIYLMEKFRQAPTDPGYFSRISAAYDRLGLYERIDDVLEPAWNRSMNR